MNQITKPDRFSRENRGFTIVELLIVVIVFLVIAAIAIPNFLKAKRRMNEASAVSSLHTIAVSDVIYSTVYGIGFSNSLAHLAGNLAVPDQNDAGLIDEVLASGTKSGYIFTFTVISTDSSGYVQAYSVNADPIASGTSGNKHFYMDQTSVIRFNDSATAGPGDLPIG